jgi:hypothetical protein
MVQEYMMATTPCEIARLFRLKKIPVHFMVLSYPTLFSFMTYHWIVKKSNTTDATSGTGNAHTSGTPEVWHVF